MSFGVRKKVKDEKTLSVPEISECDIATDICIIPYTERSIVVMGDTLNHTSALTKLGGRYNVGLRGIGQGWIFSKIKEQSIRNYMETGEVVPYKYTEEDKIRFEKRSEIRSVLTIEQCRALFKEMKTAFVLSCDYSGSSVMDVTYQFVNKWSPNLYKGQKKHLEIIMRDIRSAFETHEDYTGQTIVDVLAQFGEKYTTQVETQDEPVISSSSGPRLARKLPEEPETEQQEPGDGPRLARKMPKEPGTEQQQDLPFKPSTQRVRLARRI